ncbi:GNAT family N-acetyltransferase [Streptomyces sp. NPDC086766]|uniref:GNAT family N-acetyltransferase n=1 Tax=Streptomyces sp. NPDC086766 TaxID=3365754 RepID=UPI003809C6F0
MPPTDADASTDAGQASATGTSLGTAPGPATGAAPGPTTAGAPVEPGRVDPDTEDTLDLRLPDDFLALCAETKRTHAPAPAVDDLLDDVGGWGPTATPAGAFHLVPVRLDRDLPLISGWMNDPAVAKFWHLAGTPSVTEAHLRAQLDGDGRSVPCLGVLEGIPMSYWEIYRADLDPLARHFPARPHDTGVHLLIGGAADRGRGLGRVLLRAVADLVLDRRPACARVVAEPDLHNAPSVAAFLSAGFRFFAEIELPAKRAALMIRDRSLRDQP